ncbi:MAG: aminodeoxychorismate synthase component I [Chloroflexi bacterium]|nr:aminodeoxychorismate synthase component I [Chloroflexota bacterium]
MCQSAQGRPNGQPGTPLPGGSSVATRISAPVSSTPSEAQALSTSRVMASLFPDGRTIAASPEDRAGGSVRQQGWTIEAWTPPPGVHTTERAATALRRLPGLAWLDSALPHPQRGRWSILAALPRWTLSARGRRIRRATTGRVEEFEGDPIAVAAEAIEAEQRAWEAAGAPASVSLPFVGGAIGYLGFELARHIERLPATTLDDVGAPDLALGWYDAALVWDGSEQRGWLAGAPEAVASLREQLACIEDLGPLADGAASGAWTPFPESPDRLARFEPNLTRGEYLERAEAARRYIAAGDIYQVNLSQRFCAPLPVPGFEAYRRLRRASPAPFAAYLDVTDGADAGVEVLSSSPERLLLVDGERLETRPIKGTRPRGRDAAEDARLAAELRASAKDAAEHVMIVDLERNDLGRIAEVGSVAVPQLARLESYSHVHHLTSSVTARRRRGVGLDATLRAMLPGGSISGAPKIRALEIIDELEPTVRGVYTGAIGYFSAHGRSDLNVAIRTITVAGGRAYAHVGGAIVHDSVVEAEYRETLDKARGMARALGVLLPDEQPPGETAPEWRVPAGAVAGVR